MHPGLLALGHCPFQVTPSRRIQTLARGARGIAKLSQGSLPLLDTPAQFGLLLGRKQGDAGDLSQIHAQGIPSSIITEPERDRVIQGRSYLLLQRVRGRMGLGVVAGRVTAVRNLLGTQRRQRGR
jgi:hypothetical protein